MKGGTEAVDNDKIQLDEYEVNLLDALQQKLKSTSWDVTDESEWERLAEFKSLQKRLEKLLDGQ